MKDIAIAIAFFAVAHMVINLYTVTGPDHNGYTQVHNNVTGKLVATCVKSACVTEHGVTNLTDTH
jgi:hypothetical protein